MSGPPGGEVTMLFTDIEGSTTMLERLGDAYADVLSDHHRLLRTAIQEHGGTEIGTEGDAFFVMFTDPGKGLAAAIDGQRSLARLGVRVRMGLHSGAVSRTDAGYVGLEIHRAARIMAAAHGGQIVVSKTVRDAVGSGVELRDLGEHRLKDIAEPQWLFQPVVTGLPSEFPALRSLSASNLPMPAHRLIGRDRELADLIAALGEHRLVTLTGSGGTGKTRLAVQAAIELLEAFPNGAHFVGLAATPTDDMVVPALASVLGVRSQPGGGLAAAVADHLRGRRSLLVLDNFEHLLGAAGFVAAILERAPDVRMLVTSREPLHVAAEYEYPLLPLDPVDAVSLFEDRTTASSGADPGVAELCRRLDGLPLAIELAAARSRTLAPSAMLDRLALPLLTQGPRDRPARQQTLRATIDWSYGLLTEHEQEVFRTLSVFAGPCTLEAAEAVCGERAHLLSSLVEKSLVRTTSQATPRYWMLRTIREYASEQLAAADDSGDARVRLAAWIEGEARAAAPGLLGPDQLEWMARLARDDQTIRDEVEWSLGHDQPEIGVRIVSLLVDYWDAIGSYEQVVRWLERGLQRATELGPVWTVRANIALSLAASQSGGTATARHAGEHAVAMAERADDPVLRSRALNTLAGVAIAEGDFDETGRLAELALAAARDAADGTMTAFALNCLAIAECEHGEVGRAQEHFAAATELLRAAGDRRNASLVISNLGIVATLNGDYSAAAETFRSAITLAEGMGERGRLPSQRTDLAATLALQGRVAQAAEQLVLALPDAVAVGDIRALITAVICSAYVCSVERDEQTASILLGSAQAAAEDHGYPISGTDLILQERVAAVAGRLGDAWRAGLVQGRATPIRDSAEKALAIMLATR